ncbi:orc1/cdc6 family replication initiation protein [Candidatus Woesearchaeota archaeon]|nr:orc1/cdc6 family replication initiation protein [Candidatus Woesearchaeota archaeon]
MATWFEQLGFKENPLDMRPNPLLVGLERQEEQLVNHILKGEICFLNGLTGSGKSSLLLRVQQNLKNHTFVYLDAQELPKSFNLEEELKNKKNFFDRITFREYPSKTPVLIIDEFQATDKNLILEARAKWENTNEKRIKSIIIAQISKYLKNVTPAFKERLGNRTIELPTLDDEEMKEILKARLEHRKKGINYYNKLHNEALNLLVACADGNPRRLLEYADMLFDFHYRKFKDNNPILLNRTYMVTYWGAKEILETHKVNVNAYVYLEKEDKKKRLEAFEKRFSKEEQDWLIFLMTGSKTVGDLAKEFNVSENVAASRIRDLKSRGAVVRAGMKNKKKLWQASPHVKRLRVKV